MSIKFVPAWRRHPILLLLVVVGLIAVPAFEIWLLFKVADLIGVVPLVVFLVAEAMLGGWLMRREGTRAWQTLYKAYGTGRMPTGELANAALVLVGGMLLMMPGFVTDVLGLFCLLPITRTFARRILGYFVARRVRAYGVDVMQAKLDKEGLIEGETVEAGAQTASSATNGAPHSSQTNGGPATRTTADPMIITGQIED